MLTTYQEYNASIGNTYSVKGKWTPVNGTAPIAIYHHGANQDGWQPVAGTFASPEGTGPGQRTPIEAIAEAGYFLCSSDYGGSLWGNATDHTYQLSVMDYAAQQAGYTALAGGSGVLSTNQYLNRYISTGRKVFSMGTSMGGLSVLSLAARYPTIVGAVAGFEPVLNQIFNKTVPEFNLDASYGGNYTDLAYGTNHNPTYQAALGLFNSVPVRLWYASADTYARPVDIAQFVANVVGAGGSAAADTPDSLLNSEEILPTGQIHSEVAIGLIPTQKVLNFARRWVPIS